MRLIEDVKHVYILKFTLKVRMEIFDFVKYIWGVSKFALYI